MTLTRVGGGEPARAVKARPDGSFTVRFRATSPGTYRAAAGTATSPAIRVGVVPRVSVTHTATTVSVATVPARPGPGWCSRPTTGITSPGGTIARSRLDARSQARVAIPQPRPDRVRIVVRGEDGWSDAESPAIVVGR